MNTKTFRIILGVLSIVVFIAALFLPLISVKDSASISLCDLITINKAASASSLMSGYTVIEPSLYDGILLLTIIGFFAVMTALLTSYLSLINAIPKVFPGISGIVAGVAAICAAIFAIVFKNSINAYTANYMEMAYIGWGSVALIVLAVGMIGMGVLLLIIRERRSPSDMHSAPVAPTRRDTAYSMAAPAAYSAAYPSYTKRGSAYSQNESGYMGYGAYYGDNANHSVGRDETSVLPEWPAPGPVRQSGPVYVTGLDGVYKGARFDISDGTQVNFGRDASVCQIVYDKYDTLISRRHCAIRYNANYDMFEALDVSRNGTFIDGLSKKLPAGETQFLPHGTVIFIGSARDSFRLE